VILLESEAINRARAAPLRKRSVLTVTTQGNQAWPGATGGFVGQTPVQSAGFLGAIIDGKLTELTAMIARYHSTVASVPDSERAPLSDITRELRANAGNVVAMLDDRDSYGLAT